jgi:hypothetical protein
MDEVRKPNIFVCYTPSAEPYSIYINLMLIYLNSLALVKTISELHYKSIATSNSQVFNV